jgi:hypothetical protein
MSKKNPTEYEYPFSISVVKNVSRSILYPFYLYGTYSDIDEFYSPVARHIFSDPVNKNDILIEESMIDSSLYYYNPEEAVTYRASFHLHFISINDTLTRIQVKTLNPYLFRNNVFAGMGCVHGELTGVTEKVEPTTIEEYQLLLRIGEKLQMNTKMPPLLLPDRH